MNEQSVVVLHKLHFGAEEDGEREVGRAETGVFVALPAEGIALLDWLAEGLTVAEVKARFARRFGQEPELAEFLEGMASCGFVASIDGNPLGQQEVPVARGVTLLGGLRQESVAWLLSPALRPVYWAIWVAVPVLVLLNPRLLPDPADVLLFDGVVVNTIGLAIAGWAMVFLHECAHAVAARALGCTGSLSISRRLYFIVAQTDVSGVRSAPRNRRYAAFLAGMTWDLSIVLGCLTAQVLAPSWQGHQFLRALVYVLALSLAFQCLVFMRTDVYYALANWLRLGNLMEDTKHWLSNRSRELAGKAPRHDLSAVPDRELRIIRWYAPFYLIGSAVAIGVLALLTFPALGELLGVASAGLSKGPATVAFWDGVGLLVLLAVQFGVLAWVLISERRARNSTLSMEVTGA